jgi:uncharacterized protein (DUF2267 family)
MLIRGIYFEGWDPSRVPAKMGRDEFLRRIRQEFPYDIRGGVEELIGTVLSAVRSHVTDGEWEDIVSSVPRDLAAVLSSGDDRGEPGSHR